MNSKEEIDALMKDHDSDPTGALERLAALDPKQLEEGELRRAAWLINHVAGELLGSWQKAHELQQKFMRVNAPLQALLARAIAADLAGAPLDAWRAGREFAAAAGCSRVAASATQHLGILQFVAASGDPLLCAEALAESLDQFDGLGDFEGLEKVLAPLLNNLVTAMIDRHDAPLHDTAYQDAVMRGASAARAAWMLAGTWVNHERAHYLCALTANAVGQWSAARAAAQHGLDLIAANGDEKVDQAFLTLELSRALKGLKENAKAEAALAIAKGIAATFTSKFLIDWFNDRVRIAAASHAPAG